MDVQLTGHLVVHLATTGQCYSGGLWGAGMGGDRSWEEDVHPCRQPAFIPLLTATSMMVDMFVGDWLILKFRQSRQESYSL